jgi:predicted ribosomally synthesized peptide with nif11-like leader
MSTQAVVDFLEQVNSDESLALELAKAMEAENDRAAVTELAKNKGYEITSEELWAEVQKRQEVAKERLDAGELSDEELEAVAGGEVIIASIIIGFTAAAATGAAAIALKSAKW